MINMTLFDIELFWLHVSPSFYGLMYALSFLIGFWVLKKRNQFTELQLDNLFLYVFLGVILWWRFWYVVFYNFNHYLNNLWDVLKFWEWGMSFHWWVLWVVFAMILFSRRNKLNFYKVADEVCAILPIGLGLWRLWNYANNELLGYAGYNGYLSIMIDWIWYFPSTLLESLLEWLILWIILLYLYKNKKYNGQVASVFLIWYGVLRFIVELFFRQPDVHIWYVFSVFSMWSLLSIPMVIIWIYFYVHLSKDRINK